MELNEPYPIFIDTKKGNFTFRIRSKAGDWYTLATVGSPHATPIPVTINLQTPWGMTSVMATLYGPNLQEHHTRSISDYSTEELLLEVSNRVKAMIDDPPEEDYCD